MKTFKHKFSYYDVYGNKDEQLVCVILKERRLRYYVPCYGEDNKICQLIIEFNVLRLIIDFSRFSDIYSEFWGGVHLMARQCRDHGGIVAGCGLTSQQKEQFDELNFLGGWITYDDRDEACAALLADSDPDA